MVQRELQQKAAAAVTTTAASAATSAAATAATTAATASAAAAAAATNYSSTADQNYARREQHNGNNGGGGHQLLHRAPPSVRRTSNQITFFSLEDEEPEPKIRWQRAELIGSGAFGRVYLGLNLDTGQLMAVKHLEMAEVSHKAISALENEVRTLKGLRHENIVQYLGYDFSQKSDDHGNDNMNGTFNNDGDNHRRDGASAAFSAASPGMLSNDPGHEATSSRSPGTFSIFLEYVSGGSVRSLLDRFGTLSEDLVKNYTRQLLLGLEYLHNNGIAHRDIKAANVLIANDGIIKLADFGAAKRITRGKSNPSLLLSGDDGELVSKGEDDEEEDDDDKVSRLANKLLPQSLVGPFVCLSFTFALW